jgi:hypothetical protein
MMPTMIESLNEWDFIRSLMEEDEVDERLVEELEKIEGDILNKVDGYCFEIRRLKDCATVCQQEAERVAAKAAAWKRKHEWLKDRLKAAMQRLGERQLVTPLNKVTICGNGGVQALDIFGHVPEEFTTSQVVVNVDESRIRAALASGELPFAKLKDRGQHLRIT